MTTMPRSLAWKGIENLPPSYFSLVMATGIVSIASEAMGLGWIAYGLFPINVAAFVALWVMTGARALFYPRRMLDDLLRHAVSPGYFTITAGTCVLGVQVFVLFGYAVVAMWFWLVAVLLWLLITYAVFAALIFSGRKPSLRRGLNGTWLIAAVATQSVSVLGSLVSDRFVGHQETILFVSLLFYLMGCMMYLKIIGLIFFRMTFIPLNPVEATPPYWINMGATAITTQAGTTLILQSSQSPLLGELVPYLKGFTLFFWASGTWWIPLLIVMGIWTHVVRRLPITYSPQFWGIVFPLGMYTASTHQFAVATGVDLFYLIPQVTVYLALFAWTLCFAGLLRRLGNGFVAAVPQTRPGT
ncbi:MAG: tellurite resistance/C4-dicarboxylate transporter family protein [Rhodocyclaceae bacterium]